MNAAGDGPVRPARHRPLGRDPRRQHERGARARLHVAHAVLAHEHGAEEADHADLDRVWHGGVLERGLLQRRARRVDDVVEFGGAVVGGLVEERLDVGLERVGVGHVARVPGEARARGWVGVEQAREGVVDAGLLGGGDGDVGAEFEAGFGDAKADARAPADDEDVLAFELVGVFLLVCHASSE